MPVFVRALCANVIPTTGRSRHMTHYSVIHLRHSDIEQKKIIGLPLCLDFDQANPIGVIVDSYVNDSGWWVIGRFDNDADELSQVKTLGLTGMVADLWAIPDFTSESMFRQLGPHYQVIFDEFNKRHVTMFNISLIQKSSLLGASDFELSYT